MGRRTSGYTVDPRLGTLHQNSRASKIHLKNAQPRFSCALANSPD
jgi:hypothetical protein